MGGTNVTTAQVNHQYRPASDGGRQPLHRIGMVARGACTSYGQVVKRIRAIRPDTA